MRGRLSTVLVSALSWWAVLAPPAGTSAQAPASPGHQASSDVRWVVTGSPQIDLWYHGLAIVGFEGIGPLPLYDPGYAADIRAVRARGGAPSGALEANVERFGRAFARDSLFEFLHFLPLYFAFSNRLAMWDAVREVASGGNPASVADPTARFGASAAAYVLGDGERLAIVGDFADALEDEWQSFFEDHRRRTLVEQRGRLERLQSRWNDELAPALSPYLRSVKLDRGLLLLSPAVGFEGRIFQGDPQNREDNVVVVHLDTSPSGTDGELYAAVRELCFPLVRRVIEEAGSPSDRYEGELRSSFAAVRCGSMLLERYAPGDAPAYERHFVGAGSGTPVGAETDTRMRFERRFPIDDGLAASLEAAIDALPAR